MNKRVLYIFIMQALILTACSNAPSASQLVAQGNHAYYEDNYDAAFQAYAEAMDTVPFAGEPVYNAANTLYRQQKYTDTLESLSKSLALSTENIDGEPNEGLVQSAHYNLGNTHFSRAEWETAVEAYKESLRLNPNDVNAKYNLELALQHIDEESPEQDQQQDQQNDQQNDDQEQQDQPEDQPQPEEQSAPEDQPQDNPPPEEQQEDESGQDQDSGQEQAEDQAEEEQSGQSSEESSDESEAEQQQASEQQQPLEGLSVEQARQLVGTVGENTETLQERLQQIYVAPNPPPDKDW